MASEQHRNLENGPRPDKILRFAALSGVGGLCFGSVYGILRTKNPFFFALGASLQWAVIGSVFAGSREIISTAWEHDPSRRIAASSLAGAVTGAMTGAVMRGRRNVLPGAIVFALTGYAGQRGLDAWLLAPKAAADDQPPPLSLAERISKTSWFPMKRLSDSDYEQILQARLQQLDVELADLDKEVADLKQQQQQQQAAAVGRTLSKDERLDGA